MRKITVFCEISDDKFTDVSYELISKAFSLKQKALELKKEDNQYEIEAVGIGTAIQNESVVAAYCAGADGIVLLKSNDLNETLIDNYADIFLKYYDESASQIVLFPATPFGRMLAPKITTSLDTGLVADCTEIDFILDKSDDIRLAPTRPTFGAELMATIISKTIPECATIRPGIFGADFTKNINGKYFEKEYALDKSPDIKVLRSYEKPEIDRVDFSKSKIIFAAGAGLCSKDNSYFDKLKIIAQKLGVDYAVTRKVVDLGIDEARCQIGQTGSNANPELYVAFGISGAIQHISGMKNSKTVVSVNSDPEAEIFKYSDYKIVTDAKKVIDDILEKIQ